MEGFERYLSGSNIFLFTEINPFRLAIILKKSRVRTTAKAGDVAADDVIVPAGNTGLAPGPIISQLSTVGLATRIEAGSVWINRKTIVAKRGETITERLANVLSKLRIKSVDVGLIMKAAYEDGHIITGEEMLIDLKEVANKIREAQEYVLNVSINTVYPLPETITFLLQIPHYESVKLALNAGIFNPETVVFFIRKAYAEVLSLSTRLNMERVKEL
jgi:large subunit ribosomal protein L10